ncbi:MAG: hypothetical protein E6350_09625 [Staphylococcus epidermidis]|nr:hypothetical protein [Staphylococcus epidermidis]
MPNQEWINNTRNGLSSSKRQIRDEILNGNYEGDDAQKVLDANNYYQNQGLSYKSHCRNFSAVFISLGVLCLMGYLVHYISKHYLGI